MQLRNQVQQLAQDVPKITTRFTPSQPSTAGSTPLGIHTTAMGIKVPRSTRHQGSAFTLKSPWFQFFSVSSCVALSTSLKKSPFRGMKHYLAIFNTDNMMLNHVNNVWKLLKTEIKRVPLTATGYPSDNAPWAPWLQGEEWPHEPHRWFRNGAFHGATPAGWLISYRKSIWKTSMFSNVLYPPVN